MHHTRVTALFAILFALVFTGSLVLAQYTQPPERLERLDYQDRIPPAHIVEETEGEPFELSGLKDLPTIGQPASGTAISLGEPGLSFRYVETYGVTEMAYFEDADHLYAPYGVGVDGAGNLWVAEVYGARAMKYTGAGSFVMSIGTAGLIGITDDTHFYLPVDVGIDSSGNIWVVDGSPHRVVKYDSGGNYLAQLGVTWEYGTDNDHLRQPRSIAFDSAGNIYVSDAGNNRIQIFDNSGTYLATIGETAVPGSDNSHFKVPRHIAIDSNDNLYIADANNHRVQIFNSNHTYVATLGVTGVDGSDNSHFNWPMGVHVDATKIYVADFYNARIQIYDRATRTYQNTLGTTSVGSGNNEFNTPSDVAVDSAGNIYVADQGNYRVQKFNSSLNYLYTFGTTGVPYLTDGYHYNEPFDVAIDAAGNIGIVEDEERGHRFVKLNASGTALFTIGEAGIGESDNNHFGEPRGVAFGASGHIYVADSWNNRVQIFESDGTYQATLGVGLGTGNYQFDYPSGVAVDQAGNIYVADSNNARIQIYNSSRVYVVTLGTGEGSGNYQFNFPTDVHVDSSGNIYVADAYNHRIQVYNSSRVWQMTLGVTGECSGDFAHFCEPSGVSVDDDGKIYVADRFNQRVQIFDDAGAYLTTIGGGTGTRTGEFREPTGVDVDKAGNVYVADHHNHRIQKFAPGVPDWKQVNINGFGDPSSRIVSALASFGEQLYAGMYNPYTGAQLWRTGSSWTAVITDGLGNARNVAIDHLIEFDGKLYAGTWADDVIGGEVWRSATGDPGDWQNVVTGGFSNTNNTEVFRFAVFDEQLYAATWNETTGGELWRSSSGDSGSWTPVVTGGLADANNLVFLSLLELNGYLYIGTYNNYSGTQVWRSSTGDNGSWSRVNTDGFGDPYNRAVTLEAFAGYMYAGTAHSSNSDNPGAELWRCAQCDGSDWQQVPIPKGFGDTNNSTVSSLIPLDNMLYAITFNSNSGMEVWSTKDGTTWKQVGFGGFGDSNNYQPYWDNATAVFNNRLYVGTINSAQGGEVWMYLHKVFLPVVLK